MLPASGRGFEKISAKYFSTVTSHFQWVKRLFQFIFSRLGHFSPCDLKTRPLSLIFNSVQWELRPVPMYSCQKKYCNFFENVSSECWYLATLRQLSRAVAFNMIFISFLPTFIPFVFQITHSCNYLLIQLDYNNNVFLSIHCFNNMIDIFETLVFNIFKSSFSFSF